MTMDDTGKMNFSQIETLFPTNQSTRPDGFKERWIKEWSELVDVIYSITLDQLIQFYPDVKQAQ